MDFDSKFTISEFLESMHTKLSWKEPDSRQNQTLSSSSPSSSIAESSLANKQRITSDLCNLTFPRWHTDLLIQFWAATKTDGGGCILTTRDQPFALTSLDRGFSEYRKLSLTYTFVVEDADEEKQQLVGLPGRVFRNKLPESTPDVSLYSTTDYPQRDFALSSCGIRSSLALPVFQPSACDLLGVLELVSRTEDIIDVYHGVVSYNRVVLQKVWNIFVVRYDHLDSFLNTNSWQSTC